MNSSLPHHALLSSRFPSLPPPTQVLPALLLALDDYNTPRVQTHAGAALVNFSETCPKSILVKYLPVIVSKMEKVLRVRLEEVRPHPMVPRPSM